MARLRRDPLPDVAPEQVSEAAANSSSIICAGGRGKQLTRNVAEDQTHTVSAAPLPANQQLLYCRSVSRDDFTGTQADAQPQGISTIVNSCDSASEKSIINGWAARVASLVVDLGE